MEHIITLPDKFELTPDAEDQNQATLVVEPCFPGYGVTLGNALRRVLLSSLPGAAVTAVKIKGVSHEFSTIAGIKEDVVDIILNLKLVRVKMFEAGPVALELSTKGSKKVTARDIKCPSSVEIVNKDLVLFEMTDKQVHVELTLWVEQGKGYVPVEAHTKEHPEIGVIAVDAIFTPIKNIGYRIDNVRVGQRTDYDKLTMNIKTDGTLSPTEAVKTASTILMDHFGLLQNLTVPEASVAAKEEHIETESNEEKPAKKKKTTKKK